MKGLALCLMAGALLVSGCGSDDDSAQAPTSTQVATTDSGSGQSAAVSAKGAATPASLCAAEGVAKPKKQCTAALTKLQKGKAANPRAACKALSKKKTKGVKGKSPYAVCVSAAAKLMAGKKAGGGSGKGAGGKGKGKGKSGAADDSEADDASADADEPLCTDEDGNEVPIDSPNVDECTLPGDDDADASDSAADDSGSDDSSDEDFSDDDE